MNWFASSQPNRNVEKYEKVLGNVYHNIIQINMIFLYRFNYWKICSKSGRFGEEKNIFCLKTEVWIFKDGHSII